jgi:hypothetical protein
VTTETQEGARHDMSACLSAQITWYSLHSDSGRHQVLWMWRTPRRKAVPQELTRSGGQDPQAAATRVKDEMNPKGLDSGRHDYHGVARVYCTWHKKL